MVKKDHTFECKQCGENMRRLTVKRKKVENTGQSIWRAMGQVSCFLMALVLLAIAVLIYGETEQLNWWFAAAAFCIFPVFNTNKIEVKTQTCENCGYYFEI